MPSEETPSKTYALRKQVVHKTLCAEKNVHTAQTKRQLFDKCPVRHRVAVLRMTPYTKFLSLKVIFSDKCRCGRQLFCNKKSPSIMRKNSLTFNRPVALLTPNRASAQISAVHHCFPDIKLSTVSQHLGEITHHFIHDTTKSSRCQHFFNTFVLFLHFAQI